MADLVSKAVETSDRIDPQQLAQLHGLHLPEAIGWWPLAPGWWLLAVLLLTVLLIASIKAIRWLRPAQDNATWLKQINRCYEDWLGDKQSARYLHRINHLLREQAVHLSGRRSVARLTGIGWLDYLSATTSLTPSDELNRALAEACYQRNATVAVEQLHPAIVKLAKRLLNAETTHQSTPITSTSDD